MEVISENNTKPRYAGFWLRFLAYIIDSFVISIAGFIIFVPVILGVISFAVNLEGIDHPKELLTDGNLQRVGGIIGLLLLAVLFSFVGQWLYYALMESSKYGGTLGKLALGIRVTDMEGNRVSFARATGRYFSRIITNMTMLIGYIIAGFTEKKQALHDLIASCLVIQK
jgi:uncharacterized RDD family membrane protein YckC